jgi:hypothetical protein
MTGKSRNGLPKSYSERISRAHCFTALRDMLKKNEKYAEAAIQYKEYLKYKPDDNFAKEGYKSCSMAAEWMQYPTRYVITNMRELNQKKAILPLHLPTTTIPKYILPAADPDFMVKKSIQ